ncbi:MAG: ceramidase domain-containing protein [Rhizobiales bacterium]|nr:ceramidase domain-containing protein [Hyphomicrobiales bacterium]
MFRAEPSFLHAYCERMGSPLFWAEPLNAVTNAAFLVAALMGALLWRRAVRRDAILLVLWLLVFAIGVGSFLFHTIPNRTTVMLDVVPIQIFILVYVGVALRRYLDAPLWLALVGPGLFFGLSAGVVALAGSRALGGGIGYVPALAALFGFAMAAAFRRDPASRQVAGGLTLAGLIFALSLTFRTFDRPVCGLIPIGLHFLWHLLNAVVLGLLLRVLARHSLENDVRSG